MSFFESLKEGVVTTLITDISSALPKFAAALMLFLAGLLIAKFVRKMITRLLVAIQIDRLADKLNDVDLLYKNEVKIQPSYWIAQAVYFMLMLVFTIASTDVLGVQPVTDMVGDLVNYMPAFFTGVLILLLGLFVSDFVKTSLESTLRSMGIASASIISNVVFYILFISIALSALSQAKISTDFLANNITVIIGAGALAFAIGYGLASRELLANYMANIYNKEKIRVGDKIIIDGKEGQIVMIDQTSIVLQTHDRAIIVPMSKLTSSTVEVIYPEGQEDGLLNTGKKTS